MSILLAALLLASTPPAYPPCPTNVRELRVRAPGGHVLAARLSLPMPATRATSAPVVVMVSGAGPEDRDYSTVASVQFANAFFGDIEARLACEGVGALRFDEVGTGRSTGSYAGHATTMTLADDVVALVDALRGEAGVDSTRVAVLGHSEGGAIAAVVAARRPSIAAVMLLAAPAHRGDDVMRVQVALEERRSAADGEVARREHARRSAEDHWYRFFLEFSPAPWYRRLRQPVLVLHGAYDDHVTPVQADSVAGLARAGGAAAVYCRVYPEHGHGFYGNEPRIGASAPEVIDDIAQFARLVLVEGRPPSSGGSCRREGAGTFGPAARGEK